MKILQSGVQTGLCLKVNNMVKLLDILNEINRKITPSQLKKLNVRLKEKGYDFLEFGLVEGKPKIYYNFWNRKPTNDEEYKYNYIQALIHQSDYFDDLYYSLF